MKWVNCIGVTCLALVFFVGIECANVCEVNDPKCGPPTVHINRCPTPLPKPGDDWKALNIEEIPHMLLYSGMNLPDQATQMYLCWTDTQLLMKYNCTDNNVVNPLSTCNAPLYKYDVVEFFITPEGTTNPAIPAQHYLELEVAPTNTLFAAKILNTNNTCASITDDEMPCSQTNVHWNAANTTTGWYGYLAVPWSLIDGISSEPALPDITAKKSTGPKQGVYRANLFRIDQPKGKQREYDCWSPTMSYPPCFHIPSLFGWLHLAGFSDST